MRVVLLTETLSRNMGYIQTVLPKYMARAGAEIHVVTLNRTPYWRMEGHAEVFQGFLDREPPLTPGTIEEVDGYTLHVLEGQLKLGYIRIKGLKEKLEQLRPDVVETSAAIGWLPLDAARFQRRFGYKLFTGNHNAWSTSAQSLTGGPAVKIKNLVTRYLPGRLASWRTERCYAISEDCAEIAWRYYGVERNKVVKMRLGVDTDYFYPATDNTAFEDRRLLRQSLDKAEKEIVCIYTGMMTKEKNPLILAEAVCRLRELGKQYSAVFIGNGAQRPVIEKMPCCRVLDFMHFSKVAAYYRAADISVWPANESVSMLDAAACGLPLVVSDRIICRDHVEGNGRVFRTNDLNALICALWELEPEWLRSDLGSVGAAKMAEQFSWESVARRRLADYQNALSGNNVSGSHLYAGSQLTH